MTRGEELQREVMFARLRLSMMREVKYNSERQRMTKRGEMWEERGKYDKERGSTETRIEVWGGEMTYIEERRSMVRRGEVWFVKVNCGEERCYGEEK